MSCPISLVLSTFQLNLPCNGVVIRLIESSGRESASSWDFVIRLVILVSELNKYDASFNPLLVPSQDRLLNFGRLKMSHNINIQPHKLLIHQRMNKDTTRPFKKYSQ